MATGTRRTALREINPVSTGSTPNSIHNISMELPMTPVSPEEELIQKRGRRKTLQPYPVETLMLLTPQKTPSKSPRKITPQKNGTPHKMNSTPTRTSPRKRLILTELPESSISSCLPKKPRFNKKVTGNVEEALTALSHDQLVDLLKGIMLTSPEIKQTIRDCLPTPDLSPLENRLKSLQRNIYRSFPSTRWCGSKRDAFSYRRVSTHLQAFKKECVDQGKQLVNSQQWTTALDYVLMAWDYVCGLPDWDNPAHNKPKSLCFKALAALSMSVIRKDVLDKAEMKDVLTRLQKLTDESQTMASCTKYLQTALQK